IRTYFQGARLSGRGSVLGAREALLDGLNNKRFGRWGSIAKCIGAADHLKCHLKMSGLAVVDLHQRVTGADPSAPVGKNDRSDTRIDGIFDSISPGAKHHRGSPDQLSVERSHVAGALGRDGGSLRCRWESAVVIRHARVAPLLLDDRPELVQPPA